MKAWPFWQLALVWLLSVVGLVTLAILDARRAGSVGISIPSGTFYVRLVYIVRGLWRILPIATVALLGIPVVSAGLLLWWLLSRVG